MRKSERIKVDLECPLELPTGGSHAARLFDLSLGGAGLRGGPELQKGDHGMLFPDGVAGGLPFTVRGAGNGMLHLEFAFDAVAAAAFRPVFERLTQRRAA